LFAAQSQKIPIKYVSRRRIYCLSSYHKKSNYRAIKARRMTSIVKNKLKRWSGKRTKPYCI
jgi:hypothetical protein